MLLDVMEIAKFIYDRRCYLHCILLEPLAEYFLTFLLYLTVVSSQNGLYLALCLGCADKVDPCWLYMLALTGQDFHLVATFATYG